MFFTLSAFYLPCRPAGFLFSTFLVQAADECKVDCSAICSVYADSAQKNDCEDQCNADEEKCQKLKKQAENAENMLKMNNQKQGALEDQLNYINREQAITQVELNKVTSNISDFERKIGSLERDISEKEKAIKSQKIILGGLMQSYYDYDQQGLLELVLLDKRLSESLNQSDYIEQSGIKVYEVLNDIQQTERDLIDAREKLKADREKIIEFHDDLQYKRNNLELSESQKQSLLEKTQGEEEKYKKLLAHIEEQQQELFNFSGASNLGEVLDSVKNYPQPSKSNWAPTAWYYSQRDSRWGNQRIGNSKSLMKDYGCAVASVAMVFKKAGASTDPGRLAKEKIFSSDLINWPRSWSPGISLASSTGHGNVGWAKIDSQIKNGYPAIIYIKKTNGRGGHYVVITGKDAKDYIVHDPYFGANLYLGTSKSLVGKIGADSKTAVDQMIIYN